MTGQHTLRPRLCLTHLAWLIRFSTSFCLTCKANYQKNVASNEVRTLEPEQVEPWLEGAEEVLMGQTNVRVIEFLGEQIQQKGVLPGPEVSRC